MMAPLKESKNAIIQDFGVNGMLLKNRPQGPGFKRGGKTEVYVRPEYIICDSKWSQTFYGNFEI